MAKEALNKSDFVKLLRCSQKMGFAHTGVQAGAKLPGLLGYEVDYAHSLAPVAARILATSPWVALNDADKHGI